MVRSFFDLIPLERAQLSRPVAQAKSSRCRQESANAFIVFSRATGRLKKLRIRN